MIAKQPMKLCAREALLHLLPYNFLKDVQNLEKLKDISLPKHTPLSFPFDLQLRKKAVAKTINDKSNTSFDNFQANTSNLCAAFALGHPPIRVIRRQKRINWNIH